MTDDPKSDEERRDQILKRMLETPPKPHKAVRSDEKQGDDRPRPEDTS